MNKLMSIFFISSISLLVNSNYLLANSSSLFSGYRLGEKKIKSKQERKENIKFKFSKERQKEEPLSQFYTENNYIYQDSVLSDTSNQKVSDISENKEQPIISRKILAVKQSKDKLKANFTYEEPLPKVKDQTPNNNIFDSGVPINSEDNSYFNTNKKNREKIFKNANNPSLGSANITVYNSKLPENYLNNHTEKFNSNNTRKLMSKKTIKYPNFLLFANDVICTTQAGISDGMIFYTPHGTYKLKGNLLISSNDTYLISGNRIWLDNMVYYFDDSGVYLNNKIYNFKNNVMYKEGIKYRVEGTIVVTEGTSGNSRCIVSELVE